MKFFAFLIVTILLIALLQSQGQSPQKNTQAVNNSQSQNSQPQEKVVADEIKITFRGASAIPSSVYENTSKSDEYYDVINGYKKQIFWAYADCPIGNRIKSSINSILSDNNLISYYYHRPNLMSGGVFVRCSNNTSKCAQIYLYDNCSDKVCIINPKEKAIIKVDNLNFKNIANTLIEAKNW